jgi:Rieske Fe-S protein
VSDEKPAWRSEFPVAWSEDHLVTRRGFARTLVGVSCASFAGSVGLAGWRAGSPARESWPVLELAEAAAMAPGTSRVFEYPGPGEPCLLIRVRDDSAGARSGGGDGGFVAFAQRCTHLGCPVVYRPAEGDLQCPCHAGYFSAADGSVLRGPAPRPLPRVALERRAGALVACGLLA